MVVAVDLPPIPPVGIEVLECRRSTQPWLAFRRVRRCALNVHAAINVLRPAIAGRQRDLEFVSYLRRAVTEPIMDLELNPGGREKVELGRGNEFVPREQLARYQAGTRLEQRLAGLGYAFGQGNVARKPRSRHSHGQ